MISLDNTDAGRVAAAIAEERRHLGAPASGMVLTMLILADEESQADATAAAATAARSHPMRIITLIPRPNDPETRLDATVTVGGDLGPGEVVVTRLRGALADHANSVAVPLLLPDTPVVAYWPSHAPDVPAEDFIGRHAQRRITDASTADGPTADLSRRQAGYRPGDTDLAWARLTPWRSLLASVFDQDHGVVKSGSVTGAARNPSVHLMAAWLHHCLKVPIELSEDAGPGLTNVTLNTAAGPISLTRPDGRAATLTRPGAPISTASLPRPALAALLAEELRHLDPDDEYGLVLKALPR